MGKKRYVKPAVESEEAMEQTSLACTMTTYPWQDECDWGTNLVGPPACETTPWKGGNFATGEMAGCSVFPLGTECFVALS